MLSQIRAVLITVLHKNLSLWSHTLQISQKFLSVSVWPALVSSGRPNEDHRLRDLNNGNLFSHSSEGQKSKISNGCWQVWLLLRLLSGLERERERETTSSCCVFQWPFLCVYPSLVSPYMSIFPLLVKTQIKLN